MSKEEQFILLQVIQEFRGNLFANGYIIIPNDAQEQENKMHELCFKITDGDKTTYDKTKNITRFVQWILLKETVKKK